MRAGARTIGLVGVAALTAGLVCQGREDGCELHSGSDRTASHSRHSIVPLPFLSLLV